MLKKITLFGLGLLLVGGLLFGSRVIPYAHTAIQKVRDTAQQSVPLSFQIDSARDQLKKIDPEVKNMVWQIAKEKAAIKRLERELASQEAALTQKHDEIIALRNHLTSGEEVFVAINGKAYTNARVEEDLRHRFNIYKTAEQTKDRSEQVLTVRQQALQAALEKLEAAQAMQRELEVQVENLVARERMVDVAKTASSINIDHSQLARTREMIDDISARIDAEEEMLEFAPKAMGEIPVSTEEFTTGGNILEEIDRHFSKNVESDVVKN